MPNIEDLLHAYTSGDLSRHVFIRRLLAMGVGMGFLETILGSGVQRALAAPPPQAAPSRAPYVVVIVMDGFRADYLDLAPMPNLHWLMERGATFENAWVGHLESYTPASHATISTGATPGHSGVIGFEWRDPATHQEDLTGWYKDVIAGRLEQQLLQHGVNSIPRAIKASDPTARVVALSSEKYYAADAMGGHAADYILYGLPQGSTIVTKGIPRHVPPSSFMDLPALKAVWPLSQGQFDAMSMTIALQSLRDLDPRVLMINLPGPDIYGHRVGGPASPDVMKGIVAGCDVQLGRLFTAFRDRGILDQTVFVVTADHGMVSNTYQIASDRLKKLIREGGGDILFNTGGNCAYIWLRNPAAASRVAQHLVRSVGHAHFAHYQTVESGVYRYHPVTAPHWPVSASLEAAYQYLLDTFAGPLAPDIALSFQENTITRVHNNKHGEHGGATWGAQAIPLVIAGPGVRSGARSQFPARLMDIAPTVLALLGLEPANMDGVPLADVFTQPTDAQVKAQDALAPALTAYQHAIYLRSITDIREAQKHSHS